MSKLKKPEELSTDDLNLLHSFYMNEFMAGGVKPSDRDGSQKHNIRLWYKAVSSFLIAKKVLVDRPESTNKGD